MQIDASKFVCMQKKDLFNTLNYVLFTCKNVDFLYTCLTVQLVETEHLILLGILQIKFIYIEWIFLKINLLSFSAKASYYEEKQNIFFLCLSSVFFLFLLLLQITRDRRKREKI